MNNGPAFQLFTFLLGHPTTDPSLTYTIQLTHFLQIFFNTHKHTNIQPYTHTHTHTHTAHKHKQNSRSAMVEHKCEKMKGECNAIVLLFPQQCIRLFLAISHPCCRSTQFISHACSLIPKLDLFSVGLCVGQHICSQYSALNVSTQSKHSVCNAVVFCLIHMFRRPKQSATHENNSQAGNLSM